VLIKTNPEQMLGRMKCCSPTLWPPPGRVTLLLSRCGWGRF